jgi:hypothetical protein
MRWHITGSVCLFLIVLGTGAANAALPVRKPDAEAVVVKVVPAADAEKKAGVLVIVFLKDRQDGVPVAKDTPVHRQMGKLVPVAEAGDIKAGHKVSVWINMKTGRAEGVLIFP